MLRLAGRRRCLGHAAQHHLDARQQLARIEGLGQVVVRTHLQAQDAVQQGAARREHDHGDVGAFAQAAAQGQAVGAGQHQVQHDEVGRMPAQPVPHGLAVTHGGRTHARGAQVVAQQLADVGIVVHHQDARTLGGRGCGGWCAHGLHWRTAFCNGMLWRRPVQWSIAFARRPLACLRCRVTRVLLVNKNDFHSSDSSPCLLSTPTVSLRPCPPALR